LESWASAVCVGRQSTLTKEYIPKPVIIHKSCLEMGGFVQSSLVHVEGVFNILSILKTILDESHFLKLPVQYATKIFLLPITMSLSLNYLLTILDVTIMPCTPQL